MVIGAAARQSSRPGAQPAPEIRLESRPSDARLSEIMAFSDDVLHVDLVTLPNVA
jgi:hypothetical protein